MIRPVIGLFVGALVGFAVAHLIWTLDGQPHEGDIWSGVAAILFCGSAWLGMAVGMRIEEWR